MFANGSSWAIAGSALRLGCADEHEHAHQRLGEADFIRAAMVRIGQLRQALPGGGFAGLPGCAGVGVLDIGVVDLGVMCDPALISRTAKSWKLHLYGE